MKKAVKGIVRNIAYYFKLLKPHLYHRRTAIADDFRKIGTYSIGLSVVAGFVGGDKITTNESAIILAFGLVVWILGISLSQTKED